MTIGFNGKQPESVWTVTDSVIETVLDEYALVTPENIQKGVEEVNSQDVEKATFNYEDNWDKLQAAFAEVEAQLKRIGVIPDDGRKFWRAA